MEYNTVNCYTVPYLILQEKVKNNVEVKVVFLGGQFSHIASIGSSKVKQSLPNFETKEIVQFASWALQSLEQEMNGCAILDGLVRVDVFESNNRTLVVNEFESLDAGFECCHESKNNATTAYLKMYWQSKLYCAIAQLFS